MIPALVPRGYGHGSGVISSDHSRFIVNVPKNASSFVADWGFRNGWRAAIAENHPEIEEIIVILRDPMDRWISGIAQYLRGFILGVHGPNGPIFPGDPITEYDYVMTVEDFVAQYTDVTERLIFDVISRFDDHVWPQWEILEGLPDCRRTWFYLDDQLTRRLGDYLGWALVDGLDQNRGDDDLNNQGLQEFFRQRLQQRPELKTRIQKHYKRDYDLIEQVLR